MSYCIALLGPNLRKNFSDFKLRHYRIAAIVGIPSGVRGGVSGPGPGTAPSAAPPGRTGATRPTCPTAFDTFKALEFKGAGPFPAGQPGRPAAVARPPSARRPRADVAAVDRGRRQGALGDQHPGRRG